jgi:O-antigen/teichoic acid export membrane protein
MRYFANTSWIFGEQMLRIFAGLLIGVWVARFLGPGQFGLFSYASAFVSLFGAIAKLGLDSIVVRNLAQEPALRNVYMGTAFWLKLIGAFLTLAIVALATRFSSNDSTTNLYIFIIAGGIVFQSFEVVDFYFQSRVLSKFVSICKISQLLISSLIKLYLILIGADLFWFVLLSVVDQISLAISLYIAYRYQKIGSFFWYFDFSLANKMLRNSWPLIVSGLLSMLYMRIDQIMVREMLGDHAAGIYSAALRLSEVWYFIPLIISNSLFPAIINAKKIDTLLYYSRLKKLYNVSVLLALSLAIPMTFLSDWLVTFLFGYEYIEAGSILAIHIWTIIFIFLSAANVSFLIAENLQRFLFYATAICAATNVMLNFLLIPIYGAIGAAYAILATQIVGMLLSGFFKETRVAFHMQLNALLIFKKLQRKD